jgi:hypothetical protein
MIKKMNVLFSLFIVCSGFISAQAGDARLNEINTALVKKSDSLWLTGGALGFDLSQLALINPKVGGGENRIGFGSITSLFANYKKDDLSWDNLLSWQMAVQRLGSNDNPFTKNIDILRFGTKAGYKIMNKMNGALLGTFESLVFDTYNDFALSSTETNFLRAAFLSPATITLSPGIEYLPDENLSLFLSPSAYKAILVMNDEIADLGVHGNPWNGPGDFKNIKNEFGASARALYKNKFMNKLSLTSDLGLFYDYFGDNHGLEYIDVIWVNNFGYELIKGLSLNLLLDLRWDKDLKSVTGIDSEGKEILRDDKWMITQALFVKYTHIF